MLIQVMFIVSTRLLAISLRNNLLGSHDYDHNTNDFLAVVPALYSGYQTV